MSHKKEGGWRVYSFRCREGEHDALIEWLNACSDNERSAEIRDALLRGLGIPKTPDPEYVDTETFRSGLDALAEYILTNMPRLAVVSEQPVRAFQDKNDNGKNIPAF